MKYVSIDIETTGLEKEKHQVLSIAAIVEDTEDDYLTFEEVPKFHAIIKREEVIGSITALNINRDLLSLLDQYNKSDAEGREILEKENGVKFCEEDKVVEEFFRFLYDHYQPSDYSLPLDHQRYVIDGKSYPVANSKIPRMVINAAGKNFGSFDLQFLEQLPRWKQLIKVRQRILDPAILYVDWQKDHALPGLLECKKRVNIDTEVSHNALEDAWDVVEIMRHSYRKTVKGGTMIG